MTTSIQDLEKQIERLVQQHLSAYQRAARAAVERAFASVGTSAPLRASAKARTAAKPRATGQRREPQEIAALMERLYEGVRANPGETMTVLMSKVGGTARALNRPMTLLKPCVPTFMRQPTS